MNRIFKNTIFYLFIFVAIIGVVSVFNQNSEPTTQMSNTEFINKLEAGEIKSADLQVENGVYAVTGQEKGAKEDEFYVTYILSEQAQKVSDLIDDQDIAANVQGAEQTSAWVTFLTSMIPFVIILLLFFFLLNNAQGGGNKVMNFARAKLSYTAKKRKRFASKTLQEPLK